MHRGLSSWDRYFTQPGFVITPAVKWIIALSVALFGLTAISGTLLPALTLAGLTPAWVRHILLWQPFTYQLLHTDIWMLVFNMIALWLFGAELELTVGPRRFVAFFAACGLLGAAAYTVVTLWQPALPLVGASPAVFGLIGAYAALFPERTVTLLLFFVLPVEMKTKYLLALFGGIQILYFSGNAASLRGAWYAANCAAIAGVYVLCRRWGTHWLSLPTLERFFDAMRHSAVEYRRRTALNNASFINEKVDPILDKIAQEGIGSLTASERRTLAKARALLEKKSNG